MNIKAENVGYRELSRIADFIRVIENGNPNFTALVNSQLDIYEQVTISYDLRADDIVISTSLNEFYPADLDIDF